ncbi:NF-kappa-B-repressing factor isoform X2 [Petromyzon marinus]|uniref:NF-kappa-B-repressing factor isoform X2 n=1 Tax=Petromyzon marinus TaxID=7757 RepID=UPI003F70B3DC
MAGERDDKQDLQRVGERDGEREDGEEDGALLDSLKLPQESGKEWQARRRFLSQNLERFRGDDLDRLVSLSMVWANHIFLGCRYNSELMKKVTEMAKGIEVDQGPRFNVLGQPISALKRPEEPASGGGCGNSEPSDSVTSEKKARLASVESPTGAGTDGEKATAAPQATYRPRFEPIQFVRSQKPAGAGPSNNAGDDGGCKPGVGNVGGGFGGNSGGAGGGGGGSVGDVGAQQSSVNSTSDLRSQLESQLQEHLQAMVQAQLQVHQSGTGNKAAAENQAQAEERLRAQFEKMVEAQLRTDPSGVGVLVSILQGAVTQGQTQPQQQPQLQQQKQHGTPSAASPPKPLAAAAAAGSEREAVQKSALSDYAAQLQADYRQRFKPAGTTGATPRMQQPRPGGSRGPTLPLSLSLLQKQQQQALKQQQQQQALKQQQQALKQQQQLQQQALKQQQQLQQAVKQEPQQQPQEQQQQQGVNQEHQQQPQNQEQPRQQGVNQEPQQQGVNLRQSPFSSSVIAGKQAIFTRLHKVVTLMLKKEGGFRNDLNFSKLLTAATQASRCNPEYTYVEMSRLAPSDLPAGQHLSTQGYACEVRCSHVYLATGFWVGKNGARDRATQRALSLFLQDSVHVQQFVRRRSSILLRRSSNGANPGLGSAEDDSTMHDLVLNDRAESPRTDVLPALTDSLGDPTQDSWIAAAVAPAAAAAPVRAAPVVKQPLLSQSPKQQQAQSPFDKIKIQPRQIIFTRLHKVVKRMLQEEGGFRSELNFSKLFTAAAQESGCNPEYTYVELSRLAPADLPKDRQLPTQGYACELRCRLIYLATGYSGSKNGARDRATQRALSLFLRDSVHVQEVTRHRSSILLRRGDNGAAPSANPGFGSLERGSAMHDLVLNDRLEPARPDLPPTLSDPFCDPAPKTRNVPGAGAAAAAAAPAKQLTMHQQRCGGQWHGRGSTLREFVVLDNADNPVCVLNNSAQFNRTEVEFRFEPLQMDASGVFHWCCSLYIGGDFVTSAVGPKKAVKQTVAEQGLAFLRQTRPTITPTANGNVGNVAQGPTVSRRDILRRGGGERLSEDNVGSQLMRKMGWTGGGIGAAGREGIAEPITVHQRMAREGLGTNQGSAVTARSVEEVIREYAMSSRQDELTFSSELTLDERKCVHLVAARYNLRSKSYWRDGRRHLVLRRRMHRDDIMRELERDGQVGRYILHKPGPTMKHS